MVIPQPTSAIACKNRLMNKLFGQMPFRAEFAERGIFHLRTTGSRTNSVVGTWTCGRSRRGRPQESPLQLHKTSKKQKTERFLAGHFSDLSAGSRFVNTEMPYAGVNSFQYPSEITSTVSSTTLIAVSSSIAYAGPPIWVAHFSALAIVLWGNIS